MTKRGRFVLGFAALGLVVTLLTMTFWLVPHPSLWWVPVVFCPPSILSVSLIDVDPSNGVVIVEVWTVIALLNSALYAGVGAWIGHRWSHQA